MSQSGWSPLAQWPYLGRDEDEMQFYGDIVAMGLYAMLVARANQWEGSRALPKQGVVLKRGQLATSERDLAKRTGVKNRNVIRRVLALLERLGLIAIEPTKEGSIITVFEPAEFKGSRETLEQSDGTTFSKGRAGDKRFLGPPSRPPSGPPTDAQDPCAASDAEDDDGAMGPPPGPPPVPPWDHLGTTDGTYIEEQNNPRTKDHTPLTPHAEGKSDRRVESRSARRDKARVIVGDLERALAEASTERGAELMLGDGWPVLMAQFGSWQNLARSARHIFKQFGPVVATNHLVGQVAARLAQEGTGRAREESFDGDQAESFGM